MEDKVYYAGTALGLAGFAILGLAWRFLNWVWFRPKKLEILLKKQGFNGNPYKIFHGDTKDMYLTAKTARSKPINLFDDILPRILPFYHHSVNEYGKKSFAWIGPIPRLYIMDPVLISEILTKNNIFKKVESNPVIKLVVTGLSNYEDEKWTKHKKIVTPAFYLDKLKDMLPIMRLSSSEMINKWESLTTKSENDEVDVDVWPYLQILSRDVISRTAFGSSYEEGQHIFQLQREQAELAHHVLQNLYIPGWRFLPTKRIKRMNEIYKEVQKCVRGIVSKKESAMKLGESGDDDDLLGLMLKYNKKEIEEQGHNSKAGMSIDDVTEECKLFYFAGQESTANLLVWTMILLSIHPNWQIQAREEVQQVFGNNSPDYDGLSQLKIVTMILKEVLRLYPPGPVIMRTIYEETKLGGMILPPGVQFLLPIIMVHRDTEIWGEDAKEFKPERFGENGAYKMKNQVSYFPFSWGPRTCMGHNFAMMEAKLVFAMILQKFSFRLSPSYTHAPFYIATLKPQFGAHLVLRKI